MKSRTLILTLLLALTLSAFAQTERKHRPSREEWFKEMRQYKNDFLAREIGLTAEQRDKFFELYDEMSQKMMAIHNDMRTNEKRVIDKGDAATDAECLELAQRMVTDKQKIAQIEAAYFNKFKTVLSSRQMLKLMRAERKFDRKVMGNHAKPKGDNPKQIKH